MGTVLHLGIADRLPGRSCSVSVPFSMGTVLHPYGKLRRNGRQNVSVPFSMGTVLHLSRAAENWATPSFSPLLDGDGVASTLTAPASARYSLFQSPSRWGRCCISFVPSCDHTSMQVSVPFSMGTVLHRGRGESPKRHALGFSPLLDGDGVASPAREVRAAEETLFQSPSRWGRCCIHFI